MQRKRPVHNRIEAEEEHPKENEQWSRSGEGDVASSNLICPILAIILREVIIPKLFEYPRLIVTHESSIIARPMEQIILFTQ